MTTYYAGIGSRITPDDVANLMRAFAYKAALCGLVLRSGAAPGADSIFESECDLANGSKEIFLPWKTFNKHPSPLFGPSNAARAVAAEIHPNWKALSPAARNLVARNMHQICGQDMRTPVSLVVCWTPDGCESINEYTKLTGGTGSAIALASVKEIPVFNLYHSYRYEDACDYLESIITK